MLFFIKALLFLLISGAVFVNGFTDAPNAITCAVSTKALSFKKAVRLAAVCNLLGIFTMCLLNSSVADTINGLANFPSDNPDIAAAALCASMLSIVLFAVAAWYFGIPTSESHAMVASISGACLAAGGGIGSAGAWGKVLLGLAVSLGFGVLSGALFAKLLHSPLSRASAGTLDMIQIAGASGMAFMHGAQDGQKFAAVFAMAGLLFNGKSIGSTIIMRDHLPELFFCAVIMALGTMAGGRRIIATVGGKMVHLEKTQGASSDIASSLCLFVASLFGIPMSTTHTKTAAVMGAGLAYGKDRVDTHVVRQMFGAWIFTFPVCGLFGYLFTSFLIRVII